MFNWPRNRPSISRARKPPAPLIELQKEVLGLRLALEQKDAALRHQVERREQVEMDLLGVQQALTQARQAADRGQRLVAELEAQLAEPPSGGIEQELVQVLRVRKILYVGGRPTAIQAIRAMVESAGGELLLHRGSLEQRRGMLPALVASSDLVLFRVDCVDHDSVANVKRECERQAIAYHPLRTSSAAAFAALVTRLASAEHSQAQSA